MALRFWVTVRVGTLGPSSGVELFRVYSGITRVIDESGSDGYDVIASSVHAEARVC